MPPSRVRSPLDAVHGLSEAVLRARTPADVTGALVHALRDGLSLGQVHLSEVSQGGEVGHATVAAPEGAPSGYVQVLDERPSGVAWVVATGEPLIVPDARGSHGVRHDLRALEAIAALAVVACQNAEAYQLVRVAATTDALTGLINHGALQLRVREEISRARRTGAPLACLLLDLDDFKTVNDDHGHQAGDEQLRVVADALRGELRDHDIVARYGGDEFVLLLPGADAAGGRAVADRVAAAVPVACSIGVAHWSEPLTADELLDRADRALLLAKRTGKSRVAVQVVAALTGRLRVPALSPSASAASAS